METLKIGNTSVTVIRNQNIDKNNLTTLYDILNEVARISNTKRKDLFYSPKQVQELNKDTTNIFI